MDAVARVKELSERAKKTGRVSKPAPVQLPLWAPRKRGLPNPLARCALFTASGKTEPRIDFKRSVIASLEGYEIAYTGEELRQDDQDVFLQLVHVARQEDLGTQLQVTVHSILVALGWGRSERCLRTSSQICRAASRRYSLGHVQRRRRSSRVG